MIKVSRIPVNDLVRKSAKVLAIDGIEQMDDDPAIFTIPKTKERKLLGIPLPRKYAIDTIALLFGIDTPQGKMHVPVMFRVNRKGLVIADEFMHAFGKAFFTFLNDNGMAAKRVSHDARRRDEA